MDALGHVGVEVSAAHAGVSRAFLPQFTVLIAEADPKLALRWGQFSKEQLGVNASPQGYVYNVPTWGRGAAAEPAPDQHVEDGFDPRTDQTFGEGRTANCFNAAPRATVFAVSRERVERQFRWGFGSHPAFELSATLELPAGQGAPVLTVSFTPRRDGHFSIGYTGAPEVAPEDMDEMWQPMIWQEKRFPRQPYLTLAFRCPLPTTLVTHGGVTVGVLADPSEMPFMPMPRGDNSRFGVLVRNARGLAQPMLFAPVLGGVGSQMKAGEAFSFRMQLHVHQGGCVDTYAHLARTVYGFRDYRRNALCSLNTTFENMVEYGLSHWSRFNDGLRGCDYSTDAPGAVKNVSSLHPLGVALVTDNEAVYRGRARPMIEYMMSREKYLFTTDPEMKTQSASTRMAGPAAPLSELAALYEVSAGRSPVFADAARRMYGKDKVFNLDAITLGDRWQNALALYRCTGEQKWLDKTIAMADEYLKTRVERPQTDFTDPHAEGMFFWPSYVPQWVELLELYETTGKARYLSAAVAGARAYTQFVWMCPAIPDGTVRVNQGGKAPRYRPGERFRDIELPEEDVAAWRVSEIGLTPESSGTCKGHRGVFNAHYAPFMLRLAHYAKDDYLHDVARSAVIGRYANFPGYHMNTARTTVYEKADFPLRSHEELNGTTSLHYNHIWPHIALVLDYLVSDVLYRSGGQIDFPSHYAEGYAYLQSKVYGDRNGTFYDEDDVWLWMPKGLLSVDNVEINYLAARGNDTLYLALTNQSDEPVATEVRLNADLLSLTPGCVYEVRTWEQNRPADPLALTDGATSVRLDPKGITALAIEGVHAQPAFQQKVATGAVTPWQVGHAKLELGGTTAMIVSMGPDLTSAYVYLEATDRVFKEVNLHYSVDGKPNTMTDRSYPFEFTVPLPPDAEAFEFYVDAALSDGGRERSARAKLRR